MEKASILKWINYSKRIAGDVDAIEKQIVNGKEDVFKEWLELHRTADESKKFITKRILQLRRFYADISISIASPELYSNPSSFQQLLESFESKLSSFKQSMRSEFDMLEVTEHALSSEISCLCNEFETLPDVAKNNQSQGLDQKHNVTERQKKDIEKTGIIGSLDRKVNILIL